MSKRYDLVGRKFGRLTVIFKGDIVKQKWEARLTFQGKRHYLGSYDKIEDVTRARQEAEEKYHIPILEKYRGE